MSHLEATTTQIFFVANRLAGVEAHDWPSILSTYFKDRKNFSYTLVEVHSNEDFASLKDTIQKTKPQVVVAAGGDGTVNAVASILYGSQIKLGIIPAGSANGLARNLGIPNNIQEALPIITDGHTLAMSSLLVNDKFCVHLADMGLNAKLVRRFEHEGLRGVRGYLRAGFNVLRNFHSSKVRIIANDKTYETEAVMVVVANATMYGTGFVINPVGRLDDSSFEIIIIKKYSLSEFYKMAFNNWMPHPDKTTIIQCTNAVIESEAPMHFQVDGEYIAKLRRVEASINNRMLQTLVPHNIK